MVRELSIDFSILGPFIRPFWGLKGLINGVKSGKITNFTEIRRLKVHKPQIKPIRWFDIVIQVLSITSWSIFNISTLDWAHKVPILVQKMTNIWGFSLKMAAQAPMEP